MIDRHTSESTQKKNEVTIALAPRQTNCAVVPVATDSAGIDRFETKRNQSQQNYRGKRNKEHYTCAARSATRDRFSHGSNDPEIIPSSKTCVSVCRWARGWWHSSSTIHSDATNGGIHHSPTLSVPPNLTFNLRGGGGDGHGEREGSRRPTRRSAHLFLTGRWCGR